MVITNNTIDFLLYTGIVTGITNEYHDKLEVTVVNSMFINPLRNPSFLFSNDLTGD